MILITVINLVSCNAKSINDRKNTVSENTDLAKEVIAKQSGSFNETEHETITDSGTYAIETAPEIPLIPEGYYFSDYLGTTRENVLNWLTLHENDDYYLGTPYGNPNNGFNTDSCMRPNGRFSGDGPCMTCTGFVLDVLLSSVDDSNEKESLLNNATNMVEICVENGWMFDTDYYTNVVNSYFWGAFVENYNDGEIVSYKFDSVKEMLDSKILRKGDLIYFSPDITPYGFDEYGDPTDEYGNTIDCHIGFYWGEDWSGENLFWHSIGDWDVDSPLKKFVGGSNMISELATPSNYEYVLVIPLK